ncbi:MAG: hypothetical protein ACLRXQ_04255 [Phascolarctobacterium faecium]
MVNSFGPKKANLWLCVHIRKLPIDDRVDPFNNITRTCIEAGSSFGAVAAYWRFGRSYRVADNFSAVARNTQLYIQDDQSLQSY